MKYLVGTEGERRVKLSKDNESSLDTLSGYQGLSLAAAAATERPRAAPRPNSRVAGRPPASSSAARAAARAAITELSIASWTCQNERAAFELKAVIIFFFITIYGAISSIVDPDPHQFADDKPKCMEYEPI
jgi:hypothetical protein